MEWRPMSAGQAPDLPGGPTLARFVACATDTRQRLGFRGWIGPSW
jgi:hypothetical protein